MKRPALLAALSLLLATGCGLDIGRSCNLMMPRCAFDVKLAHSTWEDGAYTFEIRREGVTSVCTAQLPLVEGATYACDDGGDYFENNWGDRDENHPFPRTISFFTTPEELEIVVRRDGTELARQTFRPQYTETEPNGEGCGVCKNATDTLTF